MMPNQDIKARGISIHRWVSRYKGIQIRKLMKLLLRVTEMMKNQFDLKPKGLTFLYRCPYPEWYDLVALPTNYRLLEFAKFTGQDSTSTIEQVSRYLTQFGEASVEDVHRVRFFSLSLSGPAFTWCGGIDPLYPHGYTWAAPPEVAQPAR